MPDRPYTLLSCSMSIDGYIAGAASRLLLSNGDDFDRVDDVRASCDAILVGAATVRIDNPRLLVRSELRRERRAARGLPPSPAKVTVTRRAHLDAEADFFTAGDAEKLEAKLRANEFTLEDFRDQLKTLKKMGPLEQIIGMLPGMGNLKALAENKPDDKQINRVEAIINSMTPEERRKHHIIDGSRRKRIARGSGTSVEEVNRLLKQFVQMQKMLKQLGGMAGLAGGGRKARRQATEMLRNRG